MTPPSADDRGFTLGDGLFETILARAGDLIAFPAHVDRLQAACADLGLPVPEADVLAVAAHAALEEAGLTSARAAVRLTWTAGSGGRGLPRSEKPQPRLFAAAAASEKPDGPARLVTATIRRNETSPTSRLKTLSYLDNVLARREAMAAGADEALMLNTAGEIACAAAANVFWLEGSRLFTPPVSAGVLPGIARAEVMAMASAAGLQVVETRAPQQALLAADAVFLTNSLIGVRPIASLDGASLGGEVLPQQVAQVMECVSLGRR